MDLVLTQKDIWAYVNGFSFNPKRYLSIWEI